MPALPTDYRELQQLAKDLGLPANGSADELSAAIVEHSEENPALEPYTLPAVEEPEVVDPASALAPEDVEPGAKLYRVTNPNHEVHGHTLGETFAAVIGEEQEACLIEGGHVKIVEANPSDNDAQEG